MYVRGMFQYIRTQITLTHRVISNHARSPLRPPRFSFRRLSDVLQAESCLSEFSSMVRPPRPGLPRPKCSSCQPCSNKSMLHHRMYWYVLVCKSPFVAKTNCNVNRNARSSDHALIPFSNLQTQFHSTAEDLMTAHCLWG
jgi:hypothetical protein